jgi:quercetin dioxygenase-like cupin family protein
MRIHNLYADEQGESHFRDIEVEWVEEAHGGRLSPSASARAVTFRQVPATYDQDWHTAPRRQYIINLDAANRMTASDGETRVIGPGEVVLVEDTTGRGHRSQAVEGKTRHCIWVALD